MACMQLLERMQEAEAPCPAAADAVARPHGALLVGRHISDVVRPNIYLEGDKEFAQYVIGLSLIHI